MLSSTPYQLVLRIIPSAAIRTLSQTLLPDIVFSSYASTIINSQEYNVKMTFSRSADVSIIHVIPHASFEHIFIIHQTMFSCIVIYHLSHLYTDIPHLLIVISIPGHVGINSILHSQAVKYHPQSVQHKSPVSA